MGLKEHESEQKEAYKSELEIEALKWNSGWKRFWITFLPVTLPLVLFFIGYKCESDDRQEAEKFQFLTQILVDKESNTKSKIYALNQLNTLYPDRSTDLIEVTYHSSETDAELRNAVIKIKKEILDEDLKSNAIDSLIYLERLSEIIFENDTLPDEQSQVPPPPPKEASQTPVKTWWLYLGNYNTHKRKWVPQPNLMGYTTSLPVTPNVEPKELLSDTCISKRKINLRNTPSTTAPVQEQLEVNQKVKLMNIRAFPRYSGSSTNRIWVEIIRINNENI